MIIAIDAGNSTVAFGFFDGGKLAHVFKAGTRKDAAADEYRAVLLARMGSTGMKAGHVKGVVISTVVPGLLPVLFEAMKGVCNETPLVVTPGLKLGIKVGYKTPATLGADRLAAAAGAFAEYGGPVIVIDFGTATTVSVVDGEGKFVGGMIAPGLMTGYRALIEKTSALPMVALDAPAHAVGATTAEGLQSGVVLGHAAMADGLLARARAEIAGTASAVATGGLASLVVPHMLFPVATDENLTLKGLYVIYKLNS